MLNRVKLADIVTIRRGVSDKAGQKAVNSANQKYLDFVIVRRDSMRLLGTIDLVDTKGKGYKVKKDWFVSGALEAAAIPHVRIKIKPNYSLEEIRSCISNRMLGKPIERTPKVKGRVIPAPMVKARPKNTGVITPAAARALNAPEAEPTPALAARTMATPQLNAMQH